MSADFFQSIAIKNSYQFDETTNDDVFNDNDNDNKIENRKKSITDDLLMNNKVNTVQTKFTDNGTVFDPFQTINDDDPNFSSKRSSTSETQQNQQQKECAAESSDDREPVKASFKAKELFHSSINEIELITAVKAAASSVEYSPPISPTGPDFLSAPTKQATELYSSDLSDLSDVSLCNVTSNDARSALDASGLIMLKIKAN